MHKIVIMGECALDIMFKDDNTAESVPAGRMLNAAAILGSRGYMVTFVGECARDRVGDIIVGFLQSHNVVTSSIDRYTEGLTPVNLFFSPDDSHPESSAVLYRRFPNEKFDSVWPRIDTGDIVVFGSSFAFDPRVRPRLQELLNYARSRGAVIVYLPGFLPQQAPRITRVMPAILENLEIADLVVGRTSDLMTIFGDDDAERVFRRHISFYSPSFICLDTKDSTITCFAQSYKSVVNTDSCSNTLQWQAESLAGVIEAIGELDLKAEAFAAPTPGIADILIRRAALK